jgi:hypothetical protein
MASSVPLASAPLSSRLTRLRHASSVRVRVVAQALSVGEVYDSTSVGSIWFIALSLFISTYFQTFLIGYVSNVVDQIDGVGKAQRERMRNARLFLRMRKVDSKTTRKVLTFLDHTWRMHGGTIPDTKELLSQLPKHLQVLTSPSPPISSHPILGPPRAPPPGPFASARPHHCRRTLLRLPTASWCSTSPTSSTNVRTRFLRAPSTRCGMCHTTRIATSQPPPLSHHCTQH